MLSSYPRVPPVSTQAFVRLHADGKEVQVHELRVCVSVCHERGHSVTRNGPPRPVGRDEEGVLLVTHHPGHVIVYHWKHGGKEGRQQER